MAERILCPLPNGPKCPTEPRPYSFFVGSFDKYTLSNQPTLPIGSVPLFFVPQLSEVRWLDDASRGICDDVISRSFFGITTVGGVWPVTVDAKTKILFSWKGPSKIRSSE